MESLRNEVINYISEKYKAEAEYLWRRYPDYAVFRHQNNSKWFAVIMDVQGVKLGLNDSIKHDILNLKAPDIITFDDLLHREGIIEGYHLRKGNWFSVFLDGRVSMDELSSLIDMSYQVTASKAKKDEFRAPKEWLIPANPKYFDIIDAFRKCNTLTWHEIRGVRKGDTVFIYVTEPVGAILFRCLVTETDVPSDDGRKIIRFNLERTYPEDKFTRSMMYEEHGIYSVRGARGVPYSLSCLLNSE